MAENVRGAVRVSEEEVAAFISEKAFGTAGVYGMGLNISASSLKKNILGQDRRTRGVRVAIDEDGGYTIDIYLVVVFGVNIPETAWNIQKNVHDGLNSEYGIEPKGINIHVQGVHAGQVAAGERENSGNR